MSGDLSQECPVDSTFGDQCNLPYQEIKKGKTTQSLCRRRRVNCQNSTSIHGNDSQSPENGRGLPQCDKG